VELPTGTVTFVFTDISGSTRLLRELGRQRYGRLLLDYRRLTESAVTDQGGRVVDIEGDGVFAVFRRAREAVVAAAAVQRAVAARAWDGSEPPLVRIGIHTGEAEVAGDGYVGLAVHRTRRICDAARGGQTLVSSTARDLAEDDLPADVGLRDAGERRLRDFLRPERLSEVVADGALPALPARTSHPDEREEAALPWLTPRNAWIAIAVGMLVGIPVLGLLVGQGVPGLIALIVLVALLPIVVRQIRR
jgi:class 3 adenylate cyclase